MMKEKYNKQCVHVNVSDDLSNSSAAPAVPAVTAPKATSNLTVL